MGIRGWGCSARLCPCLLGLQQPPESPLTLGQRGVGSWGWGSSASVSRRLQALGNDTPGVCHSLGPNSALGNSFVRHNARQLTRVYPLGLRMNSANYNPQEMWNSGCQLGE